MKLKQPLCRMLYVMLSLLWELSCFNVGHVSAQNSLSAADIQELLDAHNMFRGMIDPPGSNIQRLQWNEELAMVAQTYSTMCTFATNPNRAQQAPSFATVGENALVSNDINVSYTLLVRDNWFAQSEGYDFDTNTCTAQCGEYTQLVWAETNMVGCGVTRCPLVDGFPLPNSLILVCNYAPEGNIDNQRPYEMGDFCSDCPENMSICIENLCAPFMNATTTPPTGTTTQLPLTTTVTSTQINIETETTIMSTPTVITTTDGSSPTTTPRPEITTTTRPTPTMSQTTTTTTTTITTIPTQTPPATTTTQPTTATPLTTTQDPWTDAATTAEDTEPTTEPCDPPTPTKITKPTKKPKKWIIDILKPYTEPDFDKDRRNKGKSPKTNKKSKTKRKKKPKKEKRPEPSIPKPGRPWRPPPGSKPLPRPPPLPRPSSPRHSSSRSHSSSSDSYSPKSVDVSFSSMWRLWVSRRRSKSGSRGWSRGSLSQEHTRFPLDEDTLSRTYVERKKSNSRSKSKSRHKKRHSKSKNSHKRSHRRG